MRIINKIIKIFEIFYLKAMYDNVDYARHIGVKIGIDCKIVIRDWGSEPYLIEIGDHVHITSGVSFVNHDGGVWVFRTNEKSFDVFGKIKIDDNSYIGNKVTILPGVTIGKNCVIGAGSIVTKSIPDNTVAAGNPIRFIKTTGEYHKIISENNFHSHGYSFEAKRNIVLNKINTLGIIKKNLKLNNF